MPLSIIDTALFGLAETSETSHSATTGVKTFTLDVDNGVTQTDYTVQIVSRADPDCWMYGVITAKTSPAITVNIFKVSPVTGTFTDWDIQVIAGPFAGLPASQTLGFSSDTASVPAVGDVLNWTIETGKAFYDNSTVYVSAVNDRTDYFFATVVSYNFGTGAIKLVVNRASGSGSNSLWAISLIDVTQSFRTAVGNANYTIKPSDKQVILTTNLTAPRVWTLPAAASLPPGGSIELSDSTGSLTATNSIGFERAGSDTINGVPSHTVDAPYFSITMFSDGVSAWTFDTKGKGVFDDSQVQINNDLDVDGATFLTGAVILSDTLDVTGTATFNGNTTVTAALRSTSASEPIGYNTGAGGTVTQLTSKSTGVTLNKTVGRITTHNAALAAGASVTFRVTNSAVTSTDLIVLNPLSASYRVEVSDVGTGLFDIRLTNITAGSLSDAVVMSFMVFNGVTS